MRIVKSHPRLAVIGLMAAAMLIFIGGYAIYIAGEANMLPWQAEPTRIVVEPFSGIPGFGDAAATPTP